MYIKLKKLTKAKINKEYNWLDNYEKKAIVGWYDSVGEVKNLPPRVRYGKVSPILIIVHSRIYREVTDGWKKGDVAYVTSGDYERML